MKTFREFIDPLNSSSVTNPAISRIKIQMATDANKLATKQKRLSDLTLQAAKKKDDQQNIVSEFVEPDPRSSYAEKLQQARVAAAERRNAALNAAKKRSEAIKQQREEDARERKMQALQDKLNQLQR